MERSLISIAFFDVKVVQGFFNGNQNNHARFDLDQRPFRQKKKRGVGLRYLITTQSLQYQWHTENSRRL